MSEPGLQDLLEVATEAAFLGGRRTLAYFGTNVAVELKADESPVTVADRECEHIIRAHILKHFPKHSILGEEHGASGDHKDYRWIIDPIDGTKTFVQGVPFYGVLIGVEVKGQASVGVVYLPAFDEMIFASTGNGCWWNGRRARVSTVAQLEHATLLTTSVTSAMARSDAYEKIAAKTRMQRTWGDCYGYMLVATGRAEMMLDPQMFPWDCAPMLPILQEAGGHFTTWSGEATIWGKDAVACNAALYPQVLAALKAEQRR